MTLLLLQKMPCAVRRAASQGNAHSAILTHCSPRCCCGTRRAGAADAQQSWSPAPLPTQPRVLLFTPIPTSLDVFSPFALHLPIQNFCFVPLPGKTLPSSQGFQGAPAPREDGEPPSERCLGSQGGRKSEPCPASPAVSLRRISQALKEQKCSGKSWVYGYPKVRQIHPCIVPKLYS